MRLYGSTLLLVFSQLAPACECAPPPPPCEAIGQTPLVFLGTVVSLAEAPFKRATMRIDQNFKGPLKGQVELYDDGMCDGPNLKVGRQYLMYTHGTPGVSLPARGCTRSRAVEAADEDLQFLRAYLAGKTSTEISGTVRYRPDEPDDSRLGDEGRTPMKGVSIRISSADRSYTAWTDANGRYALPGLPPGKYEVSAELTGYRADWVRDEFQLMPNSCAVADVLMKVDRRIEGTVHSEAGELVAGALVEMVPTKLPSNSWEKPILLAMSNETGHYAIDGIPPGDYYLGIDIARTPTKEYPYPPTYYPNTRDRGSSIPIKVSTAASVRSYDLVVPPKLKVIRVRGAITDASGLPANRPQVRIKEPGLEGQIETEQITVDAQGRFEVELCEGVRYSAFAFSGSLKDARYSQPVEFVAGDNELRLVLNKSPQEFDQLSRQFRRQR